MISSFAKPFPVLTGFYWYVYFLLEPLSLIGPTITVWLDGNKGAPWFWNELMPYAPDLEVTSNPRALTAILQLVNMYLLTGIGLILAYTTIRDRVPNLADQEKSVRLLLASLAFGDVTHILITMYGLPEDIRWNPSAWNFMVHASTSLVVVLLAGRVSWFLGIGRKSYVVPDALHKK